MGFSISEWMQKQWLNSFLAIG